MTTTLAAAPAAEKATRANVYVIDPRALSVDWTKNISRGGQEPPVDDALISLAMDMMPKAGAGDGEDGTSGQLQAVICRQLPGGGAPEVVGGFRRMRGALWLIESGTCPDFKIKYTVSRMSDAEAALVNVSENLQREDPQPMQLAFAVRALTEGFGLSMKQVAGRLKRSESFLAKVLNLVTLPSAVRADVASGDINLSAALELARMPAADQAEVIREARAAGQKVTSTRVREKRQEVQITTGKGAPVPRNAKQVREYLEGKTAVGDPGCGLASALLDYLDGKTPSVALDYIWDAAFAPKA